MVEGPKFRAFFSLPPELSFFVLSLGGLLVELWPLFKAMALNSGHNSMRNPPGPKENQRKTEERETKEKQRKKKEKERNIKKNKRYFKDVRFYLNPSCGFEPHFSGVRLAMLTRETRTIPTSGQSASHFTSQQLPVAIPVRPTSMILDIEEGSRRLGGQKQNVMRNRNEIERPNKTDFEPPREEEEQKRKLKDERKSRK